MEKNTHMWKAFERAQEKLKVPKKNIIMNVIGTKGDSSFYDVLNVKHKNLPTKKIPLFAEGFQESYEHIKTYMELDLAHKNDKIKTHKLTKQRLKFASYSFILICLIGIIVSMRFWGNLTDINQINILDSEREKPKQPLLKGDNSTFIMDVTIPDGMLVSPNFEYHKIWKIKNTGSVPWVNRYLKRITPGSTNGCQSQDKIEIAETLPGNMVNISATFITPKIPGSCRLDWKMIDENGHYFFPKMDSLFLEVHVVQLN